MNIDEIRDKFACGDERRIVEFLMLQLLTNNQQDLTSVLPFLRLSGGGRRHGRSHKTLLLLAAYMASQQQAQAAATGTLPPPANNMLPLLAALLLGDEEGGERDFAVRPIRRRRPLVED